MSFGVCPVTFLLLSPDPALSLAPGLGFVQSRGGAGGRAWGLCPPSTPEPWSPAGESLGPGHWTRPARPAGGWMAEPLSVPLGVEGPGQSQVPPPLQWLGVQTVLCPRTPARGTGTNPGPCANEGCQDVPVKRPPRNRQQVAGLRQPRSREARGASAAMPSHSHRPGAARGPTRAGGARQPEADVATPSPGSRRREGKATGATRRRGTRVSTAATGRPAVTEQGGGGARVPAALPSGRGCVGVRVLFLVKLNHTFLHALCSTCL